MASLVFTVRSDGARVVRRDLEGIAVAAKAAGGAVGGMVSRLASIAAGGLAVNQVKEYIDTYTNLQNRLRQVTEGSANLTTVTRELFSVADRTRSSFEGTANMYSRVALATKEYGYAQQDLLTFVERVNQATILSGASAVESEAALVQFTQGLASGVLRGDELRSILEQLPGVADVIAKHLGVARGELRKLGAEGKLTTQVMVEAFLQAQHLGQAFAGTAITIGQGIQQLNNRVLQFIGHLDESIGFSQTVAKWLSILAKNFDVLATAAISAGVAITTALAPAAVIRFATAIGALFVLLNAHPFVALAAAAAGAATSIALMGEYMALGGGHLGNMQDAVTVFGDIAKTEFEDLGLVIAYTFGTVGQEYVESFSKGFDEFFEGTGDGFAGWAKKIARIFDRLGAALLGILYITKDVLSAIPDLFSEYYGKAYNAVVSKIEGMTNAVLEGLNYLRSFTGAEPAKLFNMDRMKVDEVNLNKYVENMAGHLDHAFDVQGGFMEKTVNDFFDRTDKVAQVRGIEHLRHEKGNDYLYSGGVLTPKRKSTAGAPDPDPKAVKAAAKLAAELERLKRTLDPVYGATEELTRAQGLLSDSLDKTGEGSAEYARWSEKLIALYEDELDPLNAINREMNDQVRLLGMSSHEREVEAQVLQYTNQLKRQREPLDATELANLRERIRLMQHANEKAEIEDRLRGRSNAEVLRRTGVEAGIISKITNKGDKAVATDELLKNLGFDTEATQAGVDAQLAIMEQMYARLKVMREYDLISEQDAAVLKAQIAWSYQEKVLGYYTSFFENLASLQEIKSKELAAIGKAAAITQATIEGYVLVQKTLASAPYPYAIPMAVAAGIAAAANVAKIAGVGFMAGGYTGSVPTSQVAGVVHGQEYVMNAQATAQNRPVLEALNAGNSVAGETNLNVEIKNEIPGAQYEVKQIDAHTVEIIARRVVREESDGVTATNLRNPNSRTSKSLSQNTKTVRNY